MERSLMDLGTVVKKEIDSVTPLAVENRLNLNCNLLTDNAHIWGDEKKLSRAIMNLLSNAVKYTKRGGKIYIYIREEEKYFEIRVKE